MSNQLGHVYACEFSNGLIKVGKSTRVVERLKEHERQANIHSDATTIRSWTSPEHYNFHENEKLLIKFLSERGTMRSAEWCIGVEFDNVIKFSKSLHFKDELTDEEIENEENRKKILVRTFDRLRLSDIQMKIRDAFGEHMLPFWNYVQNVASVAVDLIPDIIFQRSNEANRGLLALVLAYNYFRGEEVFEGIPTRNDRHIEGGSRDIVGITSIGNFLLNRDFDGLENFIYRELLEFLEIVEYDRKTDTGLVVLWNTDGGCGI